MVRECAQIMAIQFYPELIPNIDRMHELLQEVRLDSSHYARVVGAKGAPKAALIARTSGNVWASKRHATLMLWYSEQAGAGVALLRDFRAWSKLQGSVVVAGLVDDFEMEERLKRALVREQFIERGGAYLYFPRGAKR